MAKWVLFRILSCCFFEEQEDAHLEDSALEVHAVYLWVDIEQVREASEVRHLAVIDQAMEGRCWMALGGAVVADSVRQCLRALVVVDLLQEGGAVQEEVLDLAEDEEGHCVVVEILQEALWQRYLEELPENPRHLISVHA